MQVTKIFRFEACHSVKDAYTDRCDRMRGGLHGHSYVVEVTLNGLVQADGMVMDFSLLKEKFNHIIDAFDHTFIVNSTDNVMVKLAPYLSSRFIYFTGNPTAENMAQYFFNYIASVLTEGVIVNNLTVWETVTGKATCTFGSATVPTLVVSAAIVEKWSETELNTFHANNGVELTPYRLISDIEIKMVEFGDRDTLTIKAVLKNCK